VVTKKTEDVGQAEVQQKKDAEEDRGLHGVKVDPTPDHHYTVDGVLAGKPTPETDPAHAADVRAHTDKLSRGELA